MYKRFIAMLLCGCVLFGLTGCGGSETVGEDPANNDSVISPEDGAEDAVPSEAPAAEQQVAETVNLMDGIELMSVTTEDVYPGSMITEFGVPLFQNAIKEAKNGENVLVSPISAWSALCMAEGGANGETKTQMQNVLALSNKNYHSYLFDYLKNLPAGEGYKVNLANGIWYKNVPYLHVENEFLQYNKTFFDAAAYKAPFNNDTLENINNWVSENTDGMIPSILEEIKEEDVLYLINALSFDAEWKTIYNESEVWKDVFTNWAGKEQTVEMLHSKESVYLEDENAIGFMKYYKGEKYAFVALLPKEGTDVKDYVASMTAEGLNNLLTNKTTATVEVTMPKFTTEYSFELNDILKQMGMPTAFNEDEADFSKMATSDLGNIYISKVLQKTFIAVDEKGTKAGAATAVVMANKMAMIQNKVVNLDRPFVYMIIECEHNEPLFMGTLMDAQQ